MPTETDAWFVDDCASAERAKIVSHRSEVVVSKLAAFAHAKLR